MKPSAAVTLGMLGACLTSCYSYPVNRPLAHYDPNAGYRFKNLGTAHS